MEYIVFGYNPQCCRWRFLLIQRTVVLLTKPETAIIIIKLCQMRFFFAKNAYLNNTKHVCHQYIFNLYISYIPKRMIWSFSEKFGLSLKFQGPK